MDPINYVHILIPSDDVAITVILTRLGGYNYLGRV